MRNFKPERIGKGRGYFSLTFNLLSQYMLVVITLKFMDLFISINMKTWQGMCGKDTSLIQCFPKHDRPTLTFVGTYRCYYHVAGVLNILRLYQHNH
jgi:hypothetical protein